ncbi:hypothetical protein GQX73_g9121 [Xylaria multiplex]|uniref:Uncharacterized protein n=1 Tax=Xylaria multiplex TaxID=323545 RepID=A0A7C8IIF7_9PEZI|nr:hypothetical protein GQX73_g9121 [Xylaria multiplex]
MGAGLDELIESLLTEIAFSGARGCSVPNLLVAIDSFYKSSDKGDEGDGNWASQGIVTGDSDARLQQSVNGHDLAVASKVWRWLANRSDVSIGVDRQFNHLSLEQVLALPEEEEPSSGATSAPLDTKVPPHPRSVSRPSRDEAATVRPRLHVSEERQWRTIAGHGPDLKRVPLFEWRALVDIASVKEKGILQGDLVRLTGQDKRSLPTRTDALARKGYIIKQPIVLRGGKSSKLWLTQFSEFAREHQEREGLDYEKLDLSKAALTTDLHPVPFCDKWNGETIDYLALAQAFVAIVKAWVLIRYCDARAKLGVEERVRQMRALAKTCRWLTNIGALSFVGAKFAGSNRLFKDCVKFIRDPSPAEWSHFRATPKTRMVVPSGRIGKRGEASRAVHASQLGGSRGGKAIVKKPQSTKPRSDPTSYARIIPSPWKPQKPVPNTAFEIIKRAGSKGTSNAAICRQTLGHNYRRLTAAMTGSISMPTNSQPRHLKHLSSTSQLSRIGKTMTYTFYANSETPEVQPNEHQALSSSPDPRAVISATPVDNVFSQPDPSRFSKEPGLSLTEIARTQELNRTASKKSKRKRLIHEDLDGQPPSKLPRRLGRRPTKSVMREIPLNLAEEQRPEMNDVISTDQRQSAADQQPQPETIQPEPRPPGVYRGLPNSLDLATKHPAFLETSRVISETSADSLSHKAAPEITPRKQSTHVEDIKTTDASNSITVSGFASDDSLVQSRTPRAGKTGSFWTACNPDFIPPSSELISHRKRKATQPQVLERPSMSRLVSEEHRQSRPTPTPKEKVESRFERKEHLSPPPLNPSSSSLAVLLDDSTTRTPRIGDNFQSQASRGSIILKDLEVFDATDHRRLLRQRTDKVISTNNEVLPSTSAQPSPIPSYVPPSTALHISCPAHHTDVHNRHQWDDPLKPSPNTTAPTIEAISVAEHSNTYGDEFPVSSSMKRSSTRKPLPSISHNKFGDYRPSVTLTTQPDGAEITDTTNKFNVPATPVDPLINDTLMLKSTHKSLESFARPTRPNASFGARRRGRTIQIIEYLLERNDGVFPGLRSLFMAVISVWAKEFGDLAPPDRRICQNTVNQMERDGVLKQMHFFFFDDQAKMQECVVLVKADAKSGPVVDSSDDPRVIAVKEKMREMFPEAYVPNAFSLSPDEAKLSNTKRQADEVQIEAPTPSKKARIDIEQSDSLDRTRKQRRRPDKHEMWDSGKLAVYIWSQRQKPGAMWDQNHTCLQDPTTGAWSQIPEIDPSQLGNILSSVKSARHIDASLKRKGRKAWSGMGTDVGSNKEYRYGDQNSGEMPNTAGCVGTADGLGRSRPDDPTPRTLTSVPFATNGLSSNEDTDDLSEDSSEVSDNESIRSGNSKAKFTSTKILETENGRQWPNLSSSLFGTRDAVSYSTQLLKESLPHDLQDILNTAHRAYSFKQWTDPAYGKFLRNLKTIRSWEQSTDGARLLTCGTIAPDHVYISLTLDETKAEMKPTNLEWLISNQFTAGSIPDEVKNSSPEDDEYGLSYLITEGQKINGQRSYNKRSEHKEAAYRAATSSSKLKAASQKLSQTSMPRSSMSPTQPEGFIEYKTRDLTVIPKQPRGRFNKPAAHDDKLGSKREDELLAACVVFRTLLGGLDRNLDIGLLLKHFPGMSLSAIKKFWPRVSRERKSYVQALTVKFQSAFLEAYENGKLPLLDYDDIENYDWPKLILWATQLETHQEIDLPQSRNVLHQKHLVEDATNEAADWRETWFATTSTYNRIEAVASESMSIPLPPKIQQDRLVLERARTWVRSICCTSLRGVNVKEKLVPKLLKLGNGDATETNHILEKVVVELNREKVITRTKGKDLGGNFRIHGMFSKQLEKMASTPKFRQAITFKTQLDEVFRHHSEEYIMPYASDDGSIMAVLNLQAHGRIRIETIDIPNIPFGFEPGNYEGRTFPKSYYHFKVRLVPTETYLFNEDMALLNQSQLLEPPTHGPEGKIPIWVDFFGKVNAARWADYVSMIVFTLAIKGPIVPRMCVILLKPMIDEFEVQLIIEWLDKLGLVQRAVSGCGVTAAEWWWLVAGHIAQMTDKSVGKGKVTRVT